MNLRRAPFMFVTTCVLVALMLSATAWLIDAPTWMRFFSHPVQSRPELTQQGVRLWRIMLTVTSVILVLTPVLWFISMQGEVKLPVVRERSGKRRMLTLVAVIIVALGFRAARVNESLWYDEIASWMTYSSGSSTIGTVVGNFFDPINQPFHTLLNHLSVQWFSESMGVEISFRFPALVFSLLSIIAIFGMANAAYGERAGFIAAGLAAVLPVSVLEGVEARGYSMMICFSAATTWTLVEARKHQRPWMWLVYAVLCALGVWSHFVTAMVPLGHAFWIAWRGVRFSEWRSAICGLTALGLAACLTITLYAPMIPGMFASRQMFTAVTGDQPTLLGIEGWHALLQLGGSWNWRATLPGWIVIGIGAAKAARSKNDSNIVSAMIEAAVIGLPLMIILVALSGTWMYARFTFFVLPGAVLLMAVGLHALWAWRKSAALLGMGLIFVASVCDLALRPPKQPLRDAVSYVQHHRKNHDRILVIGLAHPVAKIYSTDLAYTFKHGENLPRVFAGAYPEWIIVEYPNSVNPAAFRLLESVGYEQQARLKGWADWINGDVLVYSRR